MKRKSCPNERQIGNRGQPLWILFGIAEAWNGFFYCAKRSAENEGRFEPAATKLTLPDSVTLGVYWQMTPALALLADAGWTHWGLLKTINVVPSGAGAQATSIVEGWNDTVALSVGANYHLTESLMLQGGIGYDQSPVKVSNRSTRIPDSDRYLFGVGVQYEAFKNVTLQLAYAHIVFASASIANSAAPSAGAIAGNYSNSADTVAFGVKVKF